MRRRIFGLCLTLVVGIAASRGQYRVEFEPAPPHPIDQKYQGKLDFSGTNYDMEQNIAAAEADWRALMREKLQLLLTRLSVVRRKELKESQDAWEIALAKDQKFFFGDTERLREAVGREGYIMSLMDFMRRVRQRALDLTAYVDIFVPEEEVPQQAPTPKR